MSISNPIKLNILLAPYEKNLPSVHFKSHLCDSNLDSIFEFFRSEYGAFWKCIQAGGFYVFTQLTKMLLLATFSPDTEPLPTAANFNVLAVWVNGM